MTTVLTKPIDLSYDDPIVVTLDTEGNRVIRLEPKNKNRLKTKLRRYGAVISAPTAMSPVRSYSFITCVLSVLIASTMLNIFSNELAFYILMGLGTVSALLWVYLTLHKPKYVLPDSDLLIDAYNDIKEDKNSVIWHEVLFAYALYATAQKLYNSQFAESMWLEVVKAHDHFVTKEFNEMMARESFPNIRSLQEFFPSDQQHEAEDPQ